MSSSDEGEATVGSQEMGGEAADEASAPPDADAEARFAAEREPDISETDRFFLNGKPLPFGEWVAATMSPIGPRDPVALEAQPAPADPAVVWMSRRPVE